MGKGNSVAEDETIPASIFSFELSLTGGSSTRLIPLLGQKTMAYSDALQVKVLVPSSYA